jgi:hypothetical protein
MFASAVSISLAWDENDPKASGIATARAYNFVFNMIFTPFNNWV